MTDAAIAPPTPVPASIGDGELWAELESRKLQRKLFIEYGQQIPDHLRPPGPDNCGAYPWQIEWHNAGAENQERCLMAANRIGKTRTAAAEIAIHLTGEYPDWWRGRRLDGPIKAWAAAETSEDCKNIIQTALLGPPDARGTGWIPGSRIVDVTWRQSGIPEVAETIMVRHVSGKISRVTQKTYQQEARGFRGESLDLMWCDELVPLDIYTEGLTRLLDRKGIMLVTFTPTEGPGDVVRHFMEAKPGSGIHIRNITWDDAPHLDPVEKARLLASYPAFERDTRSKGVPMLGSGAIFPISDESIAVNPFELPNHWPRINGIDFGIDHPAAGAFCAVDRDSDMFYVYDCYKAPGETPVYHAAAMKKHGEWIPNAWPQDGFQKDKGSNIAIKDQYRHHGLYLLREHAQYPDVRLNSLEAGLIEMYEYMRTGKFRVFHTLTALFEEKRLYHRKDGQVQRKYDDILSATRYAFMMRRYASHRPSTEVVRPRFTGPIVGGRP